MAYKKKRKRSSSKTPTAAEKKYTCFTCGQKGHGTRTCYSKKRK